MSFILYLLYSGFAKFKLDKYIINRLIFFEDDLDPSGNPKKISVIEDENIKNKMKKIF